ncbi:AMP-binding protein [Streptomyces fragilis]|uniref:AMP-binding protein n=1 Tax=Streptomyces fragilis TaxID=67301 RepID=A0ABV2YQG9_9ACTN|nr:AMP-binding protein [Streptomyces fragilis]
MTDLFERRPDDEPGLRHYASGLSWNLPEATGVLSGLLDGSARRHGRRTALSAPGSRTSFRELRRTVVRMAAALTRLGLRRGDHLALLLPDCPEAVVLCHAAWRIGAIVVPGEVEDHRRALTRAVVAVLPAERLADVASGRGDSGRDLLRAVVTVEVASARRGDARRGDARRGDARRGDVRQGDARQGTGGEGAGARAARPGTGGGRGTASALHVRRPPDPAAAAPGRAAGRSRPGASYGAFGAHGPRPPEDRATVVAYRDLDRGTGGRDDAATAWWDGGPEPEDIAVAVPRRDGTSVFLRHRNVLAAAHQIVAWQTAPASRRSRLLSTVPLSTARGIVVCTAALLAGIPNVLVPERHAFGVLRAARRHAPTVLMASPEDLRRLLERPAHEHEVLASVRTIVTAPLDALLGRRVRAALDARVVEAYGPDAAAGVALANPLTANARPGTAGLALPGTRARIAVEGFPEVDVLPGHAGELLLRGPQFGDLGGLRGRPPGGRWLRTGRLAVRGPDGFVTLLGDGDGPDGAAARR